MLLGTYQVKVAPNRRVFIPAPMRTSLGENFIIARWYEQCLVLVAFDAWNALYKRLTGSQKIIVSPIRDTERFILGSAYEAILDEQGRIVIPESLVNYAKLTETISFVGLGDRVEVWDSTVWNDKQNKLSLTAAEIIERIAKSEK
jgi:MraZ protein